MIHKTIEVTYWIDELLEGNQAEKDFKETIINVVNEVATEWDIDIQINDEM